MTHIGRFISLPIGLVLVAVGIIVWVTVNTSVHNKIEKGSVILPDNTKNSLINPWTRFLSNKNDPNNLRTYVYYAYNLTNPEEVMNGELARYQELGPYHYRYFYEKIEPAEGYFDTDENIITYQNWELYVPDLQNIDTRDPTIDVITHINLGYQEILKVLGGEKGLLFYLSEETGSEISGYFGETFLSKFETGANPTSFLTQFWNRLLQEVGGDPDYAGAIWVGLEQPIPGSTIPTTFYLNNPSAFDPSLVPYFFSNEESYSILNPQFIPGWLDQVGGPAYNDLKTGWDNFYGEGFETMYDYYHNFINATGLTLALLTPVCQTGEYVCTKDDLGYVQFGSPEGMLGNVESVAYEANSGIRVPPEFGISTGGKTLYVPQTKYIWNINSHINIISAAGFTELYNLVKQGNDSGIQSVSGGVLDLEIATQILEYATNMTHLFGFYEVLQANGGPFAKHTVNQILFNATDPLLQTLFPTTPEMWQYELLANYTTEGEARAKLPFNKVYTGNDDASLSQVPITFRGSEFVQYGKPIKVQGHNAENIGPYYIPDSEERFPIVTLFSEQYARPIEMECKEMGNRDGLRYYRYRMSDDNWNINSTMLQTTQGLMNLTAPYGAPIYLSRPRMKGMDVSFLSKTGLNHFSYENEDNDIYGDYEPISGKAIQGRYSAQVNTYIDGDNGEVSPLYGEFTHLQGDVVHPILWTKSDIVATEEQVGLIRSSYKVDATRYAFSIILIVVGSLMVLSVVGLYIIDSLESKGFFY